MRVLAEMIASDVSLLVTFNQAIEAVIQNNQKAWHNPKALAQLDSYKRPLVSSLSANLQQLWMEKVRTVKSLREIIEKRREDDETSENRPRITNDEPNRAEVLNVLFDSELS